MNFKNIFYKKNNWSVLFFFRKEHVRISISKEIKNITHFLLLKADPISVTAVVLHYEELCRAPTSANDEIFL